MKDKITLDFLLTKAIWLSGNFLSVKECQAPNIVNKAIKCLYIKTSNYIQPVWNKYSDQSVWCIPWILSRHTKLVKQYAGIQEFGNAATI